MSRLLYTLLFLTALIDQGFSQSNIFMEDFDGVTAPAIPSPNWTVSSSQIFTNEGSPSSGYTGASGNNNLLARNCNPNGEARSFQVEGISTLNASGLTVSFGHRRTGSFTPPVTLQWSSNGSTWNNITYSTPSTVSTWSLFTSGTLPVGAEGQANLRFRWTYTTSVSNVPCDNFAGNYRIDDFRVDATTLPIELLHFTLLDVRDNQIMLHWQTATERDNAYFAIERSTDGNTFREIGRTPSLGNSRSPQTYTYTDHAPLRGINYYRLRQVDTDGTWSYSPVVTAVLSSNSMQIYPTTATEMLRITSEEALTEDHFWQVFDLAGRVYQAGTWEAESAQYELMVNELPQGNYVIRLTAGQQNPIVLRFQKR